MIIYTVVTDGYDRLQAPQSVPPGTRLICLYSGQMPTTDHQGGSGPIWELKEFEANGLDPKARSRYPKIFPYEFFDDETLYIDANLRINDSALVSIMRARGLMMKCIAHPQRKTVRQEFKAVVKHNKCTQEQADAHRVAIGEETLRKLPRLTQNSVIYRPRVEGELRVLMNTWWANYIQHDTRRDQLSLQHAIHLTGINVLVGDPSLFKYVDKVRHT